jgi:hypothetical protein
LLSPIYDNHKHKIINPSLYIQAKREAEAHLNAEWQEEINKIDQHAVLQDKELMRKQR